MNWNVSRLDPQAAEILFEVPPSEKLTVLLMADEHADNAHSDLALLKRHHDEARELNAPILKFGDTFCAMEGKWDRRKSEAALRPEMRGGNYFDRLVSWHTGLYMPYAKQIAVISDGNHEASILQHHQTDLAERLVHNLRMVGSPALAQPLYSGNVTLSGWTQTVTVTAGAFSLTLYTNDQITPGGTSYTATFAPSSGTGWKETWVVPTGATTIRAIRSATVPTPTVKFNLAQLNQSGATVGQGIRWNGTAWEAAVNVQAVVHIWSAGTEATCNSTTRGYVVMVQGGAGVADTLRICRKDAADAYAWTALF